MTRICTLILMILFSCPLFAGSISLSTEIDKKKATIGDTIHFSLIVTADEKEHIVMPKLGESLGQFDIRDYSIEPFEKQKDGLFVQRYNYVIANYAVGKYAIPPIQLEYKKDDNTQILSSDTVEVEIISTTEHKAKDIKDIKDVYSIERKYGLYIAIAAAFLILALIIFFIWKRFKQKKQLHDTEPEKIMLPPYEEAIQAFETLLSKQYIENSKVKLFYVELSEIIKRYLGRVFDIVTMERTTDEILYELKNVSVKNMPIIEEFLTNSDLIKFAKFNPSPEKNDELIKNARTIIETERPHTSIQINETTGAEL